MVQLLEITCTDSSLGMILSVFHKIVQMIQIIAPLLLLVMLVIFFTRLLANPDDKNGLKRIRNAMHACFGVFMVPVCVNALMGILGEKTTISSCWNDANYGGPATEYISPYETDNRTRDFITDPDDYEHGKPSLPSQVGDGKYDQYQTLASCESETMKYKIIRVNNHADLAIIWVKDPVKQFNGALAAADSFGRLPAEQILNNEINANGLRGKCLVAVNASFFSYSTNSPVSNVVVNKGKVVKNKGNASGCVGVNGQGKLVECSHQSANSIVSSGIQNTFGISSKAGSDNSGQTANRTQVCQIDTNNFVLLSGDGTVGGTANVTRSVTGCSESYNLDGGGSRKLYYQTKTSGVTKIFGGDRTVPDMLYFSEQ